jgi:acyl carrier protein
MGQEEIAELIRQVISEALSLAPELVRLDDQFWEEEVAIDTMGLAVLVEGLEHHLGIEFADNELEQITGFESLIELIKTKTSV